MALALGALMSRPGARVAALGALVLLDSGVCTAPVATAIPVPSRTTPSPVAMTKRDESDERPRCARWDPVGRPDVRGSPGMYSTLTPPRPGDAKLNNDLAY